METKAFQVEVKAADEGRVIARFATLGVKDLDGDIIAPGAFGEQRVKVSAYGHESWRGALPVGKGTIREEKDAAIAETEFFMKTTHGRDHFETVKALGDLGEWSFGFDIKEEAAPDEDQREVGVVRVLKKLEVHEVSPVLRGAGVGTRTLAVKSADEDPIRAVATAFAEHLVDAVKALAAETKEGNETSDENATPEPETKDASEPEPDTQETIAREVARFEALKVKAENGR